MPQINLLLSGVGKKKKVKSLEIPSIELTKVNSVFLPISYLAIAFLLFIWLIISFVIVKDKRELVALENKKSKLTASPQEINLANLKKQQLTTKSALLDELSSRKFFWFEKLARVALFVPDGVWLNEISLDKDNTPSSPAEAKKEKNAGELPLDKYILTIKGSAFAYKIQDAVTLIGKFNNLLKEDKNFAKDFSEVTLSGVSKSSISKTDIMNFEFNLNIR